MGGLVGLAFRRRAFLIGTAWIISAGLLSEALQWIPPGRTVSAADFASDAIGGLAGFAAARALRRLLRPRPPGMRAGRGRGGRQ